MAYQQTQEPRPLDLVRSTSYQGSNQKHAVIGGNGQISPVSHNSIQFTENDNKISFGSYDPSGINFNTA
jgi:hypothetical protein